VHSRKETPISEKGSTEAMDVGGFCKVSFLLLSRECTPRAGHGRRRNNMLVIGGRVLEDFMCFIYGPAFKV